MARLHMAFDIWMKAGKPAIDMSPDVFHANLENNFGPTRFMVETCLLQNSTETPEEVVRYVHKHLPCDCLVREGSLQQAKTITATCAAAQRHKFHKRGLPSEFKRCSKCKEATYCGRECQVADWKMHKTRCKVVRGKKPTMQDLDDLSEAMRGARAHP